MRTLLISTTIILALGAYFQPIRPMRVVGESMQPTLRNGQFALISTQSQPLERGHVVVIRRNGENLVKRVAYLPGDKIPLYPINKEWQSPISDHQKWVFDRLAKDERRYEVVPVGHVFVIGDNPSYSTDSRTFGPIPVSQVLGVVLNLDVDNPVRIPGAEVRNSFAFLP